MVRKLLGFGVIAGAGLWAGSVHAQRLDIPRLLTVVVPHTINQQRCLESANSALQTAGFSDFTTTGSANDRTIYGKADGTNALFRCSQSQRVIVFVLSTVNGTVDTKFVGEAVMELFAQSAGMRMPR